MIGHFINSVIMPSTVNELKHIYKALVKLPMIVDDSQ